MYRHILNKVSADRLIPMSVVSEIAGSLLMLAGVVLRTRWVFVLGAAVFAPGALFMIVALAVGVPLLIIEKWRGGGLASTIQGWLSLDGCAIASALPAVIGAVLIVAGSAARNSWVASVGTLLVAPFMAVTLLVVIVVFPIVAFTTYRNRRKD